MKYLEEGEQVQIGDLIYEVIGQPETIRTKHTLRFVKRDPEYE